MAELLIETARADITVVDILLFQSVTDDEAVLGVAAYHLQQAAEKSLKSVLEYVGQDYRVHGHSIGKCLRSTLNHAPGVISQGVCDDIRRYTSLLTDWETAGRYPSDFLFELSELKIVYEIVARLYNECAAFVDGRPWEGIKAQHKESNAKLGTLHFNKIK